jgi:hypothetical protein
MEMHIGLWDRIEWLGIDPMFMFSSSIIMKKAIK